MLRTLTIAALLFTTAAGAADFQLRLVAPCGPSDKAYTLEGTTHEMCLAPGKVLDQSAVVRAQRYPMINRVIVDITEAGSEKLYTVSSENVGKDLAVLFENKLIFRAPISEPLKLEKFQLSLNNAPEAVDALVAAFPGAATP